MKKILSRIRLFTCSRGAALIEFAFVLPILVLIIFGAVEMGRYAIIHMKLDKTANSLADFVTQATVASFATMNDYAAAANQIMRPYLFDGTVIFTSVAFFNTPLPPCTGENVSCVTWQYKPVGGSPSRIGIPGGNADMPGNYQVIQGQNAIVAEIFYNYEPMLTVTANFIPILAPHSIYKAAVYKPRQGTLTAPPT